MAQSTPWLAAAVLVCSVAGAVAQTTVPAYKVFDQITRTPAAKAKEATFIKQKVRQNPKDPNYMNRKPTDLILSISMERPEPNGCLAIARDIIQKEKFTTQTVKMFFYKAADLKNASSLAEYNMEWSRADGFHAGGLGQPYHRLDVK